MSCTYSNIANFGKAAGMSPQNDPLTYCAVSGLESGFQHTIGGGNLLMGPNSGQCQYFMAQYCAQGPNGWDGVCEYLSNDNSSIYPNMVKYGNGPNSTNTPGGSCFGPGIGNFLSKGQILIRNTASEKYLKAMSDNCERVYEPFDPTAADSPLISKWVAKSGYSNTSSNTCIPVYDIDTKDIDSDIVMNKLLSQPWIALDILINIYNTRMRTGRIGELSNTKLGRYFFSPHFQQAVGAKARMPTQFHR